MNQLDSQPVFPPGSFFHNKQPLSESPYQQQQAQVQQGQQQGQPQRQQPQGQHQVPSPQQQQQQQQYINQSLLQRQQYQAQQLQLQQQQHQQQQHQHQLQLHQQQHGMYNSNASNVQPVGQFTSAPYTQAMQTGAINAAQQQAAALRHSASPLQPNSPYTTGTPQPQPQQSQIKYPMAAPPLPNTPSSTPQSVSAVLPTTSAPSTPQSPNLQHIEQSRIKLLFEINVDLIQEISSLQEQGRGGATSPQHQMQLKSINMDDKMASEEYIQTMRRVQANLAYLAPRGNLPGTNQKSLPGPAHMTPPHQMPQLQGKYNRLRELFPGWGGMDLVVQHGNFNTHPGVAGTNRMTA